MLASGSPSSRTACSRTSVYVLTPQGKVIDLPRGATPVDFAYAVHTNLGHRCRGARVDGRWCRSTTAWRTASASRSLTVKQGGPSRDWLNPDLGYVASHRARAKVRQWFKQQQLEETVAQGRALVERELARAGATPSTSRRSRPRPVTQAEEFFAAVARDEVNLRQIQIAIRAAGTPSAPAPAEDAETDDEVHPQASRASGSAGGILIVGVDRLMTGLARCCKPAPPDAIVGFVTRGKGITIHRAACANLARARREQPERLIESNWGAPRDEVFPVDIIVEAGDRPGLLRDLSRSVLPREDQRHGGEHAVEAAPRAHDLHARGAQRRRAQARARAGADVPGVLGAARR